jgi:outer membrane protein TolC
MLKKKLIGFLIITLVLTSSQTLISPSYVYADTTTSTTTENNSTTANGKLKVNLDNIKDIMIENSLNMKTIDNNLKITKENYNYNKDQNGTIPELRTKITDTQSDISAFTPTYDPITGKQTNTDDYNKLTSNLQSYKNELNSSVSLKFQYLKAQKDYNDKIETAVYQAQTDYLNYLVALSNVNVQEDQTKIDNKTKNINQIAYDSGFIAKKDNVTAGLNTAQSNNTLNDYKNAEALAKTKLCNELGVQEDNVEFQVDVTEDFQKIESINYENDLNKMLENNLSIQEADDNISQLKENNDLRDYNNEDSDLNDHNDTLYNYNLDNANISLEQAQMTTKTDFQNQYNTLISEYNAIKNSYNQIIELQSEYKAQQIQVDYGFLAANDLENNKLNLDKKTAQFIKDRNTCYLAYLKYIEMKEGY